MEGLKSMEKRFASIEHPDKHGYSYNDEWYHHSGNVAVTPHFRVWATLGDGFTQHAAAYPIGRDLMADYLMSLAAAMLPTVAGGDNTGDDSDRNLIQNVSYEFTMPNRELIEFAASVKWRESDDQYDKRRWFSVSEKKIGGRKFEHDKRYQEIKTWCDGSTKAIYRMIIPECSSGLKAYCYATAIREWATEDGGEKRPWMPRVVEFLEWTIGREEPYDSDLRISNAFTAVQEVVKAWTARSNAQRIIKNRLRTLERKREQAAEPAADAA